MNYEQSTIYGGRFICNLPIEKWFENTILGEFFSKPIIVMDNAAFHRKRQLTLLAKNSIIFLPPYSPELNPIEHFWAFFKTKA